MSLHILASYIFALFIAYNHSFKKKKDSLYVYKKDGLSVLILFYHD